MILRAMLASALLGLSMPAAAYVLTGTIAPGGGDFYAPITFDHDGSVSLDIRLVSTSGFGVDALSSLTYLDLVYYDYYDPQTGEYQGGNDNFGADQPFVLFGNDATGPGAPRRFAFATLFPFAGARHDYVLQNPGDPFPYETGYTETFLNLYGTVVGNADPVTYTITVDGTAVVPEPAAWGLFIGGFGLAGTALRRRRAVAA